MHRPRISRRYFVCWAPLIGAIAVGAFPAAAAATPLPTPCATPVVGSSPCYTVAPTISPSSEWTNPPEGRILSIPATAPAPGATPIPGTWSPAYPTLTGNNFSYQWQDCDAATGLICSNINGAITRTYAVAPTDVGSRLQVIIKASISAGTGYAVLESAGPAVTAVPIDRVAPSVSGPTQDGQTLTASPGTWAGTQPIAFTYQWRRCASTGLNCGAVFTAPSSSPTYTLQDADLGHTMSVVVTASNPAGSVALGSFAEPGVVTPGNTGAPGISGIAQQGKTLTEVHGSWLPSSPAGYAYQWEDCDASGANCSPILGATSQTYKLGPGDVGHTVAVQEAATAGGVTSSPATSGTTGIVQGAPSGNGGGNNGGGNSGGNNNGVTSSGGQTGNHGTPSGMSPARIRALVIHALILRGQGARIGALLKRGVYSFSFAAPSAGRLVIAWSRIIHGKRVLVAIATIMFHKAGAATINLALTGKGRNLLRRAGRMQVMAVGGFTPAGGGTISASRRIMLRR
jgi:hypothetical protein